MTARLGVDLGATWLRACLSDGKKALWTERVRATAWRDAPSALRAILSKHGLRRVDALILGGTRLGGREGRAALTKLLQPLAAQVKVVPEGGSIAGLFRSMNACLDIFVRYSVLRSIFRWTLCPVINLCGAFAERIFGSGNDQFAPNYSAWARK